MLQRIEIDGFRSLIDFKISFQRGLNVIVGSNGSGKSNFISFLDFLGTLIDSDLNSAIAVAQGAGSMFSKERFSNDKPVELTFKLEGHLRGVPEKELALFNSIKDRDGRRFSGNYSYRCVITYLASVPAVYISLEELLINSDGQVFSVSRNTTRTEDGFETKVALRPSDNKHFESLIRYIKQDKKSDPETLLAQRVAQERSILPYLSGDHPAFDYVIADLIRYRSVNIDPAVARKPSPVGSDSSLRANGEGLAGALYHLKGNTYYPGRGYGHLRWGRRLNESTFQSIISWCREVNPSIEGVRVTLDVMEAQLRPYMQFNHGLVPEEFSFNRISDGTVKWLALATVLFAEPDLSVIEEPENFLHPFMQETFIALCREALEKAPDRAIVISTHSPTLLDCCAPQELTLFELADGATKSFADRESRRACKQNQRVKIWAGLLL